MLQLLLELNDRTVVNIKEITFWTLANRDCPIYYMTLRTGDNSFQEAPCEPFVPLTEEEEAEVDCAFAPTR